MVLKDPRDSNDEFVANDSGAVTLHPVAQDGPAPSMVRTVTFGGRDWSLGYYAKANLVQRASEFPAIGRRFAGTWMASDDHGHVQPHAEHVSEDVVAVGNLARAFE